MRTKCSRLRTVFMAMFLGTLALGCGGCVEDDVPLCLGDAPCARDGGVFDPNLEFCSEDVCTDSAPPNAREYRAQNLGDGCLCRISVCHDGFMLTAGVCVPVSGQCSAGQIQEGNKCVWRGDALCHNNNYTLDWCVQDYCVDHPSAMDATDLEVIGKCVIGEGPVAESCTNGCHNGTEGQHAIGGALLTCTDCHGGDPTATDRLAAHVPLPDVWQQNAPRSGLPNLRYYFNYFTLTGVENFDGGLEWLRFRNPSDLRIADRTCGKNSGCHADRVDNMRRSLMATAAGIIGGANARSGIERAVIRNGDGVYQFDSTQGFLSSGDLTAIVSAPDFTGLTDRIVPFVSVVRSVGSYDQTDVLREIYDKQCGGCHLTTAGRNDRYASYRGSGCAACHMTYGLDGVSRSDDPMVSATGPTYPPAFTKIANFDPNDLANTDGRWLGPERAHPMSHAMGLYTPSERCGSCHADSNRTDWQFRGIQIDPNRTARTALENGILDTNQVQFSGDVIDEAFSRYHGLQRDQLLSFIDWDDDGFDDIPSDIHYAAGLECIDCHTSGEMHNELRFVKVRRVVDWSDPNEVIDLSGALWSHQDQATEVECVSCHGNLEFRALSHDIDNRNPMRNIVVCAEPNEVIPDYTRPSECQDLGNGRWLKAKFSGRYHYIAQTLDTVSAGDGTGGTAARPDGVPVYTLNASIYHGRVNDDPADGVGPCIDGDPAACVQNLGNPSPAITPEFSHLGRTATSLVDQQAGGLECYACHATWVNNCFGCHVRLADNDGSQLLRDFKRTTGELSIGMITEADVTYVSPNAIQFGINSEGKIAPFISESNLNVAHTTAENYEFFGTDVVVNNDSNIQYNAYRHRSGYGLRRYSTEFVGLAPGAQPFEQFAQMDNNAGQGINPMMPHTIQRSHPRMSCTNCHLDPNAENRDVIATRYMARPDGFGGVSAYLDVLAASGGIVRAGSRETVIVDPRRGFLLGNPDVDPTAFNIDQQADLCVGFASGFPYCYTNHPAKSAGGSPGTPPWPSRYSRPYPTFALTAGPFNIALLDMVFNRVALPDVPVTYRGPR